ncbi:MAG: putative Ig domain-containing protein [Planctomycetes bacterium]|nr:putative Ig domain-containing protein [Planctomycetota bacterium]
MSKAKIISFICAMAFIFGACTGGGSGGGGTPIGTPGGTNSPPLFTSTAPTNAIEGTLYTYQATATDADANLLSWLLATAPTGMTVSPSGLVQWTPTNAQIGNHAVELVVSDGIANVSQNWTITVSASGGGNLPPVITSAAPTTATESQLYSYQAVGSDPNSDPLTWTLPVKPAGMSVGASTGLVSWTPTTAQVGTHNVTLEVSDGLVSASQSWTITVSAASTGGGGTATGGTGGTTGTVNGSYQGRGYRLHVPAGYSQSTPSPLVIALHGLGDTHTNFHSTLAASGWTGAANSNNFILMTPAHMNSTRASFLHLTGTGGLDQQATQTELAGAILAAYYGAGATHNIETTKIYVIGFSEGAVATDLVGVWFSEEIRAIAPYAGGVTGKPFPAPRDIPVYGICGTADSGYTGAQQALAEWTSNSHTTNSAWVSGVGHTFSTLCSSGPSPSSVYTWLSTASFSTPVTSAWQAQSGGGGNPSGGSGGAAPGNQTRSVTVSGLGSHTYYLYIPSSYTPGTAVPVMFAFHGAGGAGTAPAAAQAARNDWASVASSNGFIVVAQAATGSGGGWLPNEDTAIFNAIYSDVAGAYNIEQTRRYAWGFSAGGHYVHLLALNNPNYFAAYGVSAGALQALAGTGAPSASLITPISSTGRRIPVHLYVGSSDTIVPPAAVQSDRNNFQANGWTLGTNLWYTEFTGGHTYSTTHLTNIWNNLKNHSLP